jgi:hypothetical protein
MEHAAGGERIDLAELSGLDTARDDAGENAHGAHGHLLDELLVQIGEVVQLAQNEAVENLERRRAEVVPGVAQIGAELFARGGALRDHGFDGCDVPRWNLADHLAEERFLVGEVEIDGALGDARRAGDVFQPSRSEPAFAKDLERCVEDLARAFAGEAPPAR